MHQEILKNIKNATKRLNAGHRRRADKLPAANAICRPSKIGRGANELSATAQRSNSSDFSYHFL